MTRPARSDGRQTLDYGFRWFEYHASQRIHTFNLYVVIYSGMAVVTAYFLDTHLTYAAMAISAMMAVVSGLFWQLDQRNRQLIKIGELMISRGWREGDLDIACNPIELADVKHRFSLRYKHIFWMIFSLGASASVSTFVYTLIISCGATKAVAHQ